MSNSFGNQPVYTLTNAEMTEIVRKEVEKSKSVSVKKSTITSTIKDGALINGHLSSYPNFGEKYANEYNPVLPH